MNNFQYYNNIATNNPNTIKHAKTIKKTWVPEEDRLLLQLIDLHGSTNWSLVAQHMESRTGKQCRERYFNHLQPNIKKTAWTENEDNIILAMQSKIGNQWSAMTRFLPGRTDNSIKNRWHAICKAHQLQQPITYTNGITTMNTISSSNGLVPPSGYMISGNKNTSNTSCGLARGSKLNDLNTKSLAIVPPLHAIDDYLRGKNTNTLSNINNPLHLLSNSAMKDNHQKQNVISNGGFEFDRLTSKVAQTVDELKLKPSLSLDILSYYFQKDLDRKDLPVLSIPTIGTDLSTDDYERMAQQLRASSSLDLADFISNSEDTRNDTNAIPSMPSFDFSKNSLDFTFSNDLNSPHYNSANILDSMRSLTGKSPKFDFMNTMTSKNLKRDESSNTLSFVVNNSEESLPIKKKQRQE